MRARDTRERRAAPPIFVIIAVAVLVSSGCTDTRATQRDCASILDRIVEIEMRERGFRDPALAARRREELRRRFASDLDGCVGRPLSRGAMQCVREARTTEELSHECLH